MRALARTRTRWVLATGVGCLLLGTVVVESPAMYRQYAYRPAAQIVVAPGGIEIELRKGRGRPAVHARVERITIEGTELDSNAATSRERYEVRQLRWSWLPGKDQLLVRMD